jgi:class 3 adenylate cyclase/tetratricopeptide (TPR) repeat protein
VTCPSCSTQNEVGRKFCAECGARLASGCPTCGAANAPTAKFCGECGSSLTGAASKGTPATEAASVSRTATATERRTVSVMFADLVGFTTFAEGRDAEEVRDLQGRYFATARTTVERYGGIVEKFIGDAVMAVWGAPVGHEDDPERAVRAALDLVAAVSALKLDRADVQLAARAAVMTGEAAVSIGAGDQALVSGDLVNTASRLQSAAPTGAVLMDGATRRATALSIAAQPLGDKDLRGKSVPIDVWRAEHVVALRGGRGRSDRLEPPFVGRESEFQLLKDNLHAAASERRARLVSITGLAGIGKSRLAWEIEKYIDGIAEDVYWHQGRSPAYGEGITFWALAEMVRQRAGIAENDDRRIAGQKLIAALEDYVPDEEERQLMSPSLLALLGQEDAPDGERDTTFAVWRRLFERMAERGVVVLVFEDLQWADTGLIDFIESILAWSRNHRILVVTLARPEVFERRPTWGAGQRNFTALHLDPLPDQAIARMLDGVVPGLPRAFVRRIIERAAGVPLFAVETVRMLMDEGRLVPEDGRFRVEGEVGQLAIPESLRGLIGARLDGLSEPDRVLVQNAAVLGQTFTLDALEALTDLPGDTLASQLLGPIRREIIALDEDSASPERGQYRFVQCLIREVAYDTLGKRDRRSRHLAAARYFEAVGGDQLAGVLASHYVDAYLATPEGPEAEALGTQARVALRGAAERAASLGSYDLAVGYFEKALGVTPDPSERARTLEAAASAAHFAARFDASEGFARRAFDQYRLDGDRPGLARAAVHLAQPYLAKGQEAEAIDVLEPALAFCSGLEMDADVVALVAELARAYMIVNDPRALETVDRALAAAETLEIAPTIAGCLITKAGALDFQARRMEAIALLRGAIDMAAEHRLVDTELRGRANLANQLWPDDPHAAFDVARDSRELARRMGSREQFRWLTWGCVGIGLNLGAWDWVLEQVAEVEETDLAEVDPDVVLRTRATVAAYRGDTSAATEFAAAADAVATPISRPEFIAYRHVGRAEIEALTGHLNEAFDEAIAGARLVPFMRLAAPAAHYALWTADLERARAAWAFVAAAFERGRYVGALRRSLAAGLAALEGRLEDATRGYREAAITFRALDLPLDLGVSQLEFATLVEPRDPEARAAAAEAREIFTRLGSPALLDRLATGLERWASEPEASRRLGSAASVNATSESGRATTESSAEPAIEG